MVKYPSDWNTTTLGFLGDVKMCKRIFQSQTRPFGQIPFYKIGTFGSTPDAYISRELFKTYKNLYSFPKKGDVMISAAGTIGRTVVYDGKDAYFQDSNIVWLDIDPDKVDRNFLMYFYQSYPWENLEGTTIRRLYNGIIRNTTIHLPPLPEQKAIANTLTAFDAHIANLSELIEKKKAIRDGALEDLVSGRTRLAGFRNNIVYTTAIGSIQKVERGKRLVRNQLKYQGDYPVYQNSMLPLGYYDKSNCKPYSVFIIAAGSAGEIGFSDTAFWAADDCYYLKHHPEICQKYLYYALLREQEYLRTQSRRTSIPRLSRGVIDDLKLPLPQVCEQKAIADTLTAMDDEITALEAERNKMIQIREGAMDDLLTGRIRLKVS